MNLDPDLVAPAQAIIEAPTATATVHAALQEVVRRHHMARLASWDFDGFGIEELEAMRRPRTFGSEGGGDAGDGRDAS